jgi:hypothetical protein
MESDGRFSGWEFDQHALKFSPQILSWISLRQTRWWYQARCLLGSVCQQLAGGLERVGPFASMLRSGGYDHE